MDYTKKTREELISLCKENGIKGYSGKKKNDIIELLSKKQINKPQIKEKKHSSSSASCDSAEGKEKISRLNYIGSKFQLLDWLSSEILLKTKLESFENISVADLFAGTGVVSYFFRKEGAKVISNDAELYSSYITHAFTCSTYTDNCKLIIDQLNEELNTNRYTDTIGFVTKNYSPYEENERKFFTTDNAKRIDYLRKRIEELKSTVSEDEYKFIVASLLNSADSVSNVPAVYGCFLKNFKSKATKTLSLTPIHNSLLKNMNGSSTYNNDVLDISFLRSFKADIVYLDPPYNERQYSKNYFPLNIIAKTPEELEHEPTLKGKTGIPQDCFLSPFCKKGDTVEKAFDLLFKELKAKWIFVSYNSESLVSKEKMIDLMNKYGIASVVERDYKRFKSFEYNEDKKIKEYLFCLETSKSQ